MTKLQKWCEALISLRNLLVIILINGGEAGEEISYIPSSIIQHQKTTGFLNAFFKRKKNETQFMATARHGVLISLLLQGLGYLAKFVLEIAIAAIANAENNKKLSRKYRIKAALTAVALVALAAVTTVVVLALSKTILAITFAVQSGIDFIIAAKDFGKSVFNFFKQKCFSGESKNADNAAQQIAQKAPTDNSSATEIKSTGKKLLLAGAYVALAVLSCLPIPIVQQAAQITLAVLALATVAKSIYDRYQKYKEQKNKKRCESLKEHLKQENTFTEIATSLTKLDKLEQSIEIPNDISIDDPPEAKPSQEIVALSATCASDAEVEFKNDLDDLPRTRPAPATIKANLRGFALSAPAPAHAARTKTTLN